MQQQQVRRNAQSPRDKACQRQDGAEQVAEEGQAQHPLHPERSRPRTSRSPSPSAMPQKAIPPMRPRCFAFRSNERPQAGSTSWRMTNEKAEATRAMQLATNSRRGFMRSISGAGGPSPHGRGGLDNSRELLLDNRVAAALPGGTRPRSIARRSARIEEARAARSPESPDLSRFLRYSWAAPTTLVGLVAGVLTLVLRRPRPVPRGGAGVPRRVLAMAGSALRVLGA